MAETYSQKARCCEWCNSKDNLIQGTTYDGKKLLTCEDSYACGERWPAVAPGGRVGAYEGSVGR